MVLKIPVLFLLIASLFLSVSCGLVHTVSMRPTAIHVLIPGGDNAYWLDIRSGLQDAGQQYGEIELVLFEMDGRDEPDQWVKTLERSIRQRPKVVLVLPLEDGAFIAALERARQKDIHIIFLDETLSTFQPDAYLYTDNEKAGREAAAVLAGLLQNNGKIVLLNTTWDSPKATARERGFEAALENYPGIILINTFYCEGDRRQVRRTIEDILAAHPDVQGFFAACPETAVGTSQVLKDMGLEDIAIVGFDQNEETGPLIADGSIKAAIVQNPHTLGYTAYETARLLLEGGDTAQSTDVGSRLLTRDQLDEDPCCN